MVVTWKVWAICVLVLGCVTYGSEQGSDRWVWRRSARSGNRKASSIPGYVEPSTTDSRTTDPRVNNPTTQTPSITTYRPSRLDRPSLRGLGRGAPRSTRQFQRIMSHPFFLGAFPPFSLVPISPQIPSTDGTTKSRAPVDTAFDGAVLDAGDKYTTLDRLQQERGPPPPIPRPQKHQLGGLHPDEVFYADDDLLIIKGGGFNSNAFQEPSQTLDEDDNHEREGSPSQLSPVLAPLPSSHSEYNGNIPAIVPPPGTHHHPYSPSHQSPEHPFSLFVEAASDKEYILVPHVMPRPTLPSTAPGTLTNRLDDNKRSTRRRTHNTPHYYYYTPPAHPVTFLTRPAALNQYNTQVVSSPSHNTLSLPHSLAGDTDVNFLPPLPKVNPQAETFIPQQLQHQTPQRYVPGGYVPERNVVERYIPGRYVPERHIPGRYVPPQRQTQRYSPEQYIPGRTTQRQHTKPRV